MKVLPLKWAVVATLVMSTAAVAHHSFAMFDRAKIVVLKGTVTSFQWTNPHAWIEIDVPDAGGKARSWGVELNSPNNLTRQGWKRTAVKPGDKVTIRVNPLRNGSPGGLFLDIVLPDGKVLDSGLPKDGTPVNTPLSQK